MHTLSLKNGLLTLLFLFFPAMISCVQNVSGNQSASSLHQVQGQQGIAEAIVKPAEKKVQLTPEERETVVVETIKLQEPEPPEPSFAEVASQIFSNVPEGKVLAFVEFTNSSGEVSKFSQAIFQEVEPVLISEGIRKNLSFIERKDLKLLMDEWDLNSIFSSGGDTGAQMLLGADYIMTGKARLSLGSVHCVFKLVDLKDGRIVGTSVAKLPAEPEFYSWENTAPPEKKPEVVSGSNKASSKDHRLSVWTDKKTYLVGEKIQLFFEVTEPLYVELIDVTPEGKVTTLFPNPEQTDNYCMPGRVYSIPPKNGSFELLVTPPAGVDRIKALASTSPFSSGVHPKTRGIQFTKSIVENASIRASLSFEIQ